MPWRPHFPHTLCVKQSLLGLFLPSPWVYRLGNALWSYFTPHIYLCAFTDSNTSPVLLFFQYLRNSIFSSFFQEPIQGSSLHISN